MESLESLKDYLVSDEIQRIESLTRQELERELIAVTSEVIYSLSDINSIQEYGKQRQKT